MAADATGLAAGKDYFFRFRNGTTLSPVGRTRTLPSAGASSVSLAVFSCSNYPSGYFNVYAEAGKSAAQFAVHLGDFMYEYAANGYASTDAVALGRVSDPANECLALADYRKRYAQYRSDPDSKVFFASLPMIAVWDDHEVANDTYKDGAENHTAATAVAAQATLASPTRSIMGATQRALLDPKLNPQVGLQPGCVGRLPGGARNSVIDSCPAGQKTGGAGR